MKSPEIRFSRETLAHFDDMIEKEWLVTNGLGGYASSTILGVNTRKYHGLLIGAVHPPRDRRLFLAKLDEDVVIGNSVRRLGTNEFPNAFFPKGYEFLQEFSISPFPKCIYSVQDIVITKTIFMPHRKNAVVVKYAIKSKNLSDVRVRIFPMVNWRPFHSTTEKAKAQRAFQQESREKETNIAFRSPRSTLLLMSTDGRYVAEEEWIEQLYFREEEHRGESCLDDCLRPGYFEFEVKAGGEKNIKVIAVADEYESNAIRILRELPSSYNGLNSLFENEVSRHASLLATFYTAHDSLNKSNWLSWLILATDSFVVTGKSQKERVIIAGYPWFESWGRDTFISLPGLLLATGRFEDAKKVFLSYARFCRGGLIPNFIPEQGEQASYNSVDGTLWYVNAIFQYLKYTGDFNFVYDHLWDTLTMIFDRHVKGTDHDIHVDTDGLLLHGPQLTWMDSSLDGKPVNPRAGKAVEVQALWYNALGILELLSSRFGEDHLAEDLRGLAKRAQESFSMKFWNEERNCLCDVVTPNGPDESIRPNQIIAVALDFTALDNSRATNVVDLVMRELLTPYGLRTLERDDPRYLGTYAGDRHNRDNAYHNGTVWPWLLGPFTTAFLKVKGDADHARGRALKFLLPLLSKQVSEGGIGMLSEIFDGEPPHKPRGCIAQAWSVAEPLRAYFEDVIETRLKHISQAAGGQTRERQRA